MTAFELAEKGVGKVAECGQLDQGQAACTAGRPDARPDPLGSRIDGTSHDFPFSRCE
jgi:hypothetical protein